jgi:predicted ATP-grasp superfamily ATP-dependent carboligase
VARTVLVTDGEERSTLAVVRSLGKAGHRVFVVSRSGKSLAGSSRYAAREDKVPNPLSDPERYTGAVRDLVRAHGIDTLIPMTEAALLALLPHRESLAGVLIPFPDLETFQAVSDKQKLLDAAAASGIAVPAQTVLSSPEDVESLDRPRIKFPVVLKPSRSVVGEGSNRTKVGVRHAANQEEFDAHLWNTSRDAFPILVQQRIVGPGVGIFLLLWDGVIRAVFSHRRLREKPPSGGISVYRESIATDPGLLEKSRALLQRFDWEGVAMIEYKIDEATGTPYLMEINGRFWGSLQLPIDAGVDFPALLLEVAAGKNPPPVTHYNIGVRSRWWWGDVDHLLVRLRRSSQRLSLPAGAPSRLRAMRDFLTRNGQDREEILRRDDPKPFVVETLNWFRGR